MGFLSKALLVATVVTAATTSLSVLPVSASTTTQTFYVDCSKSGVGSGTIISPWTTLDQVNKRKAFTPGSQVLIKRNTTCRGRLHPRGNGAVGHQNVIGAYGSGARPILMGAGTANHTATVELHNQSYWTVQDLHVTNTAGSTSTSRFRSGILITNNGGGRLSGLVIRRNSVSNVSSAPVNVGTENSRQWGGITAIAYGPNSSYFDKLLIQKNVITRVGSSGIFVANWQHQTIRNKGLRISGNQVVRARGDSIVIYGSDNSRIDHNVSAYGHDMWPCPRCGGISPLTASAAIWPGISKKVIIDHNEVYGEYFRGGDGVAFDADGQTEDVVFEYNYAHDNEGGGILFCGSTRTTARFNILENNSRGAFVFIGSIPANKTSIYNNTVYTSMQNGAQVVHTQGTSGGKGINFYNNLIYNMGWGYYVWPAAYKSSHNTVVGTHGIGEPRGNGTIFDTPILRSPGNGGIGFKTLGGYHPSSPKDDPRGVAIPKSVTKDFFGNTINPKSPPRGAAIK